MGKHHTEIQKFRIFALVLDKEIFVGKSAANRMSAVYSRHRCGTVAATQGHLDREQAPTLHILKELSCTGSEAYRHVLAWIHLFSEAGYSSLNHPGTEESAECLYSQTEAIYKSLPQEPAERILEKTRVQKPADADRKPMHIPLLQPKPEKNIQMNLRMSPRDKKRFDRFCQEHGLRARDALGLLLDQVIGEDSHRNQILVAKEKELEALRRDKRPAPEKPVWLDFLLPGLKRYIQLFYPPEPGRGLPVYTYKGFHRQLPDGIRYAFPDQEGFFLLEAEATLWGKHKARFIVGQGENGEYLKLRSYPKPYFSGVHIWNYPPGTLWLVGCRKANDGAMEIAASFPVPLELSQPEEEVLEPQRKSALDEQIDRAEWKKHG